MNNVDITIQKLGEFQELLFSPDSSPNSLFKASLELKEYMLKASVEINTNYETISKKLTEDMNGRTSG